MNYQVSVVKPETVILTTDERYIKDEPTILVMNEKISFKGNKCSIKDISKNKFFKCTDKSGFSDGKVIKDMEGNKLLSIKKDSLLGFKEEIKNLSNDKKIGTVSKTSLLSENGLELSFRNKATHSNETLTMKFNSGSMDALILYERYGKSTLVGKITYKSSLLGNKYYIEIAPKVDLALMASFVIAFDTYKHE